MESTQAPLRDDLVIELRDLPDHYIAEIDVTGDGYVIGCACGWRGGRIARSDAVTAWVGHSSTV